MKTLLDIKTLRPQLIEAAQRQYDSWQQDDEGYDETVGAGGICHLIADDMVSILHSAGIMAVTTSSSIGENHVWVTCRVEEGVYTVDIPPYVYEHGSGYVWTKKQNVLFSVEDLVIDCLSSDWTEFKNYAEDFDSESDAWDLDEHTLSSPNI